MKIYTKIFIGMAAGVAVGALLGPNSLIAERETIYAQDGSRLPLMVAPGDVNSRVVLPAKVSARLKVVGTRKQGGKRYRVLEMTPSRRLEARVVSNRFGGRDGASAGRPLILAPKRTVRFFMPADSPIKPVWGAGVTIISVLDPVGTIFMRLIKMLIVPLVFCSLLVGVASLGDVRQLGRLGGRTLGFFMVTTILAISIGVVSANLIKPGKFIGEADKKALSANYGGAAAAAAKRSSDKPSASENIVGIVPKNPIAAMSAKRPNMLQIIFFALIMGVGCTLVPNGRAKQLVALLDKINDAMIMMIHMSMAIAPYGVFALVAKVVGTSGWSVLGALLVYSLVVIAGLLFHALVVYSGTVRWVSKLGIWDFWQVIRPAQLIAFSTSSSAVALPLAMETSKENLGVSNHVSSFVLPLGATINMDGTALYQGVAALFIAQVFGIDLSIGDQLNIILTATLASIGTAAVPGVGMITLAMVLTSVGVPTIGVALILGVDRILDMFRSAVNTTGNLAAACIVASWEGETPRILSPDEDAKRPDAGLDARLAIEQHPYQGDDDSLDGTRDAGTPREGS